MASDGGNRPNRWLQSPVTWIGGVAILGLVIVGVFGIRSLVVSSGEETTGGGEGTALAARAEEERAEVESGESPVDTADGIALGDRPDEEINDPPLPPEEAAESSSPGPPEAEESDELPAPVATTPEPSAPTPIAEDEDIEFEIGVGSPMSWGTGAGWIVPWGDEILEIGWLKIGEEPNGNGIYDETHLVARALVDSRTCQNIQPLSEATDFSDCWEDLYEYPTPYEGGRISAIISDGRRLVVASETDDQIYVSVTSDLDSWDTAEIELPHPSGFPDFVYASSYIDHLAVNSNGWLAKITTELSIDVLALAGVREPKTGIRSVYELEDDVRGITGDSINSEGLFIEW